MYHADSDNARQTGPALEAMCHFMPGMIPTIEKFPRGQKFLLGDRIERLIEATDTDGWRARIVSRFGHDEESLAPGSR